jgi:hypothetical protein
MGRLRARTLRPDVADPLSPRPEVEGEAASRDHPLDQGAPGPLEPPARGRPRARRRRRWRRGAKPPRPPAPRRSRGRRTAPTCRANTVAALPPEVGVGGRRSDRLEAITRRQRPVDLVGLRRRRCGPSHAAVPPAPVRGGRRPARPQAAASSGEAMRVSNRTCAQESIPASNARASGGRAASRVATRASSCTSPRARATRGCSRRGGRSRGAGAPAGAGTRRPAGPRPAGRGPPAARGGAARDRARGHSPSDRAGGSRRGGRR